MKQKALYLAVALGLSGLSNVASANEMVNPDGGVVVGYWHNWCDGAGYKGGNAPCVTLDEVDPMYNVVNVSFMKVFPIPAKAAFQPLSSIQILVFQNNNLLIKLAH